MIKSSYRWKSNTRIDIEQLEPMCDAWIDSTQDSDYWNIIVNVAFNPLLS